MCGASKDLIVSGWKRTTSLISHRMYLEKNVLLLPVELEPVDLFVRRLNFIAFLLDENRHTIRDGFLPG
jgi:hypothetical protein